MRRGALIKRIGGSFEIDCSLSLCFSLDCCWYYRTHIAKNHDLLQSFRGHEADETKYFEFENIANDLSCFYRDTMSLQDDSAVQAPCC